LQVSIGAVIGSGLDVHMEQVVPLLKGRLSYVQPVVDLLKENAFGCIDLGHG
jgi:hypothetical protein